MGCGESIPKLYVCIIEASDVPKMDTVGKSDPYCEIKMRYPNESKKRKRSSKITKTNKIKNTDHPKWNQHLVYEIRNISKDHIKIVLKDHDALSRDDAIAFVKVPLSDLQDGQVLDKWYEMELFNGVSGNPKIHLTLRLDLNP